jgi:phenylacetate-CoA ligase
VSAYDLTVVAPCYNEAANLGELVLRLQKVFERNRLAGEIVLVDDGSEDDTGAVIAALARANANVVGVRHDTNRGIEAGWRSGLQRAQGEYVCFIDADLQNLPEDVWRLYREIQHSHADLVQGCRSTIGRLKDSRYLLSRGLNVLLNGLFGVRARDNKSGFVLARRETLADVLAHRLSYRYYQTFIRVAAESKGYTVREVETLFESRLLGQSFMPRLPLRVIAATFGDLAKGFVEFRLLRQRERPLAEFLRGSAADRQDPPLPLWRRALWRVFFLSMPLHAWMITRRAEVHYADLKRTQWLAPREIRELQQRRLRKLIQHAYLHVPYYRERMRAQGLRPEAIATLEDLRRLPLLGKEDVREHLYFDLLADNKNNREILKITTSGSTGEPFVCYADRSQLEMRWAATLRSMEWTGYRFGDRQARLWHQTIGMSWHQVLRERLDAWLSRRIFIPAFELSEADVERALVRLRRHRPTLIDGYAECFAYLAEHARRHGIREIRPKGIISSAQVLPDDDRRAVEEAFSTRVFDKYGSREFSGIAYECDARAGHHVVAESYIVEILKNGKPAPPGELGEVVVTDLNNHCMPFIRYRIGDLAVAIDPDEPCPCGRGLPRIGRIEGRVQSMIVGAGGFVVPGSLFLHLLKDYNHAIRQFQVLQEQAGVVTLKVVKAPRFDVSVLDEALRILKRYLGHETRIEVEFVEEIPMVRTGKRQVSLSRVKIDFQELPGGAGRHPTA